MFNLNLGIYFLYKFGVRSDPTLFFLLKVKFFLAFKLSIPKNFNSLSFDRIFS